MSQSTSPLRRYGLVSLAVLLLLLSLASGVWAQPSQRGLRMTVPTRTPTKAPVVVEPTMEPAQPTATPKKDNTKPQPTQAPTEQAVVAEPTDATPGVVDPAATETAAVLVEAGYPASGADKTKLLLSLGTLGLIVFSGLLIALRNRARSAG